MRRLIARRGTREDSATEQVPTAAPVEPVAGVVPKGLRIASEIAWRSVAVVIGIVLIVYALQMTSSVVIPVGVALLFTSILVPLVSLLDHRVGLPRYLAGGLALLLGLAVVIGLLAVAGGQLVTGFSELGQQVSAGLTQIQDWLRTGPLQIGGDQLSDLIAQGQQWLSNNTSSLTRGALTVGSTATNFVAGLVIALVVTFFLLGDGANIWGWCVRLLPYEVRSSVHNAFRRGWITLGSYVRTQMIVAAIDAIGIAGGAALLGLPLVVPLGLIVFFSSFVPMVGAIISGALAVVLALVVQGPLVALLMVGVVLLVQQIESNVLQPILMSRSVSLHPLATLLGVAVGSYLAGIVGAVFAVPIMAVTNTVVLYLRGHDQFPDLGQVEIPGGKDVHVPRAEIPPAERAGHDPETESESEPDDQTSGDAGAGSTAADVSSDDDQDSRAADARDDRARQSTPSGPRAPSRDMP